MSTTYRPKLNSGARHAFLYGYYKHNKDDDDEFPRSICRILIINHRFLDIFMNGTGREEECPLLAYVNLTRQTIELKTGWNDNSIYSSALGLNTNLILLKLARFQSIQLCLLDFGDYTRDMIRFWVAFCRVLHENRNLKYLEIYNSSYPHKSIIDQLPDKIRILETDSINYPWRKKFILDRICLYSYSELPDYTKLLQIPALQIEVQRPNQEECTLQEILRCLPIQPSPYLQHLIIEIVLMTPTCNNNFEPCTETWSEKYYDSCAEFFEQLRQTNPDILIEASDHLSTRNWIRHLDDAIRAHNTLTSNIRTFVDLADKIRLKFLRIRVDNRVMNENYTANFAQQVASKLGSQTFIVGNKIVNTFEYKNYCFNLHYSYRSV